MTGRRELSIVLLSLLAATGAARGQRRFEPQQEFSNFHIDYINGDVFTEGEFRKRTDTPPNTDTTKTTNTLFREGINLRSAGSVYHPNFLAWQATGRFGQLQESNETDSPSGSIDDSGNGDLLGYSVNGLFFREKPLTARAFSLYDENTVTRDFTAPLEYRTSENGVELRHRGDLRSSLLLKYSTDYELSDVSETDEKTWLSRFTTGQYEETGLQWEFTAQHEDTDEESGSPGGGSSTFSTQRDEFTLDHFQEWGPYGSSLSGSASFTDQRGFFNSQSAFLDETLTLGHTPTFSTFYRGHYDQTRSDDEVQDVDANETYILGEAGYRKMFYQSLEVIGRVFVENRKYEEGSEDAIGAEQDFRYRKQTPLGLYRSNLLVRRSYENEDSDGGFRRIVGEGIALSDGTFVALGVPGVAQDTIRVFNSSRTRLYQEGVDYVTRQSGEFTEIARLIGSPDPIGDGEVVEVDYSAATTGDISYTNDRISWSQALTIDSLDLTLFSRVRHINESLTDGDDPGNLEKLTSLLGGVEWSRSGLTLTYEYEVLDTELGLPFTGNRFRARYDSLWGSDLRLSLGASAEFLQYDLDPEDLTGDPDRDEDYLTTYTAFAEAVEQLNRNTLVRLRSEFYQSEGRQDLTDAEVSAAMEWKYRELELAVEARYRMFEQEDTDGDVASLMFVLRRYF